MAVLSTSEKIKIILGRRDMTLTQLAEATGQSRQNLTNKLSRNNFSEQEIRMIADALRCSYDLTLTMLDTGERI